MSSNEIYKVNGDNFITEPLSIQCDGQLVLKDVLQPIQKHTISGKGWNPVLVRKESRMEFYNKVQEEEERGNSLIEVGLIYIDKENGKIYFIERAEN